MSGLPFFCLLTVSPTNFCSSPLPFSGAIVVLGAFRFLSRRVVVGVSVLPLYFYCMLLYMYTFPQHTSPNSQQTRRMKIGGAWMAWTWHFNAYQLMADDGAPVRLSPRQLLYHIPWTHNRHGIWKTYDTTRPYISKQEEKRKERQKNQKKRSRQRASISSQPASQHIAIT